MIYCARCGKSLDHIQYDVAILPGQYKRLPVCRDQYSCYSIRTKVRKQVKRPVKNHVKRDIPPVVRANRRYVV